MDAVYTCTLTNEMQAGRGGGARGQKDQPHSLNARVSPTEQNTTKRIKVMCHTLSYLVENARLPILRAASPWFPKMPETRLRLSADSAAARGR